MLNHAILRCIDFKYWKRSFSTELLVYTAGNKSNKETLQTSAKWNSSELSAMILWASRGGLHERSPGAVKVDAD